jgi:hypothetical protein
MGENLISAGRVFPKLDWTSIETRPTTGDLDVVFAAIATCCCSSVAGELLTSRAGEHWASCFRWSAVKSISTVGH